MWLMICPAARFFMYGAGVLDMKSGLLMLVHAFKSISKSLPDGWQVEALINSDEERGSAWSRETLLKILTGSDLVFSFEGNRKNCLTISRKGVWTFEIDARGIAAHTSGGADKNKNAIYMISKCVNEIYVLSVPEGVNVNIGTIEGGTATNVVADRSKIKGEIRASTEDSLIYAEEMIKRVSCSAGCSYRRLTARPPLPANENTMRLFDIFHTIAPELIQRPAGGGGDAAFAYLTGTHVIDGLGAEGGKAHTRREYAEEENIERRLSLSVRGIIACMNEYKNKMQTF